MTSKYSRAISGSEVIHCVNSAPETAPGPSITTSRFPQASARGVSPSARTGRDVGTIFERISESGEFATTMDAPMGASS